MNKPKSLNPEERSDYLGPDGERYAVIHDDRHGTHKAAIFDTSGVFSHVVEDSFGIWQWAQDKLDAHIREHVPGARRVAPAGYRSEYRVVPGQLAFVQRGVGGWVRFQQCDNELYQEGQPFETELHAQTSLDAEALARDWEPVRYRLTEEVES